MNYDLCDLLNRKMEYACGYMTEFPRSSTFKNQNIIDENFELMAPEHYIETMSTDNCTHEVFSFWMYRNGKISNQVDDYEKSARRVTKELANLSYSNNPSLDIMYFSGLIKVSIAKNKAILVETCIRPTLDQMLNLKDCELKFLDKNGKILWRINERKKKAMYYEGVGLNDLHSFKWSRIK
jgi:hypothetical protein